jgi:hypothetical protein
MIYTVSIWLLPVLFAITFHEAAHGFVARFLGDETASRLGRVSLNLLREPRIIAAAGNRGHLWGEHTESKREQSGIIRG